MEYRTYLQLAYLSASDLKRSWLSGDQTEATAWIDPSFKKSTGVISGGRNMQWQEKLILPLIDTDPEAHRGKWLTIQIRSQCSLGLHHLLGSASVPLAELIVDLQTESNSTQTYQLVLPSGKRLGSVSFLGKVVGQSSSGSVASLPSAPAMHVMDLADGNHHFNVLDRPPVRPSYAVHMEQPSNLNSAQPYPPFCPQKLTGDEAHHNQNSSQTFGLGSYPNYTSWGLASCSPQYFPPLYPPDSFERPTPYSAGMTSYPPYSNTPYTSCVSTGPLGPSYLSYPAGAIRPNSSPQHLNSPYPPLPIYGHPFQLNPVYTKPY